MRASHSHRLQAARAVTAHARENNAQGTGPGDTRRRDEIRKVVEAIYSCLHTEYGLAKIIPSRLSLLPFVMEFKKLEEVRKGLEDQMKTTDTLLERIHRCSIYAAGGLWRGMNNKFMSRTTD